MFCVIRCFSEPERQFFETALHSRPTAKDGAPTLSLLSSCRGANLELVERSSAEPYRWWGFCFPSEGSRCRDPVHRRSWWAVSRARGVFPDTREPRVLAAFSCHKSSPCEPNQSSLHSEIGTRKCSQSTNFPRQNPRFSASFRESNEKFHLWNRQSKQSKATKSNPQWFRFQQPGKTGVRSHFAARKS